MRFFCGFVRIFVTEIIVFLFKCKKKESYIKPNDKKTV